MESAIRDEEHRQLALKLRLAATAKEPMGSDMRRRELAIAQPNSQSACEIAEMIAGGWVGPAQMGRASEEATRDVGLGDEEVIKGGPRSKMAKIAVGAGPLEHVQRCGALGSRTNSA